MSDEEIPSRGEGTAVAVVASVLILLVTLASCLTLPSAAWADSTDSPSLVDRSAPAIPVNEPAIGLDVMPGREC